MGEAFPAKMLAEWCNSPSSKVATTDFYQIGTAHNWKRFSLSTDMFLIDQSNQQVYIPDDGSFEFKGPSRTYGYEVKSSFQLNALPGSQRRCYPGHQFLLSRNLIPEFIPTARPTQ